MKSERRYNLQFRLVLESFIHEIKVSVIGHCKKDIIIKGLHSLFSSLTLSQLFIFALLLLFFLSMYFITPYITSSRD